MDVNEKSSPKPVPSEESEVKNQARFKRKNTEYQESKYAKQKEESAEKKGLDRKEIESLIVKLHHEGQTQSVIGAYLKDQHNIKSVKKIVGKTILDVLKDNKMQPEIPEDLTALLKKAVILIKHQKENKKDTSAKRGYILTVSKIRALARYYKSKGVLPKDWVYDENKAALLVK